MKTKKLVISILTLLFIYPTIAFANFTDNTAVPSSNNTPLPLNTSSSTQVKTGALVSDSYLQADVFYDRYNSGYYLQPRGTNRVNYIVADNQFTYGNNISNGEVQGAFFRDRDNGSYYVDPSGNSRVVNIYADSVYSYGAINAPDVYLRNAGRWASQVRGVNGYCIQCGGRDRLNGPAQCTTIGNWTNWSFQPNHNRYEDYCRILIY